MVRTFRVEPDHAKIVAKSTLFKALNFLDRHEVETPCLLMDRERIRHKALKVGSGIRKAKVFYAVKANPEAEILQFINELGMGFEIASEGELSILRSMGVEPERIISSNPVKSPSFLQKAYGYGVRWFAFDSKEEVDKMARWAPDARLYVRLSVPNEGSEWPLSRKFGVELEEALHLLLYARERGLMPMGVTFHVGSQCTNLYNWSIALDKTRRLWDMALEKGIQLEHLNMGGGYPINYTKGVPTVEMIEENINRLLEEKFPELSEIHLEPGRAIVGDAGIMVTEVIGKAKRGDENWLYINVGVFNGLMESLGGIRYTYLGESNSGRLLSWTLAGPSCDSFDVIDRNVRLHEPHTGSLLLILSGGAYTTSYASEFNGFPIPRTLLI
jgi:ornithine decarboxylase